MAEPVTNPFKIPDQPWVAVFANPYARRGPGRIRLDQFMAHLDHLRMRAHLFFDREIGQAVLHDPKAMATCHCAVAVGGDGTILSLLNEDLQVPLATMPMGNENLFAQEFGFETDPITLAEAVVAGRTRITDLGLAGDQRFSLMISAGFDAAVTHRIAELRTSQNDDGLPSRVNRLSYLRPTLMEMFNYDFPTVSLEVDGERTVSGAHVLVFNLPRYGGDLQFTPQARGDDALLDWIVLQRPGRFSLVDYAWTVLRCKHLGRPDVPHGQARHLRLTSDRPMPIQADGDPIGFTPIDISIVPAALRVIEMPRKVKAS